MLSHHEKLLMPATLVYMGPKFRLQSEQNEEPFLCKFHIPFWVFYMIIPEASFPDFICFWAIDIQSCVFWQQITEKSKRNKENAQRIKFGKKLLIGGRYLQLWGSPPPPLPKSKNVLSCSQPAWAFLSCSSLSLPSLYFSFLGKNKARISCGAVSGGEDAVGAGCAVVC